MNEITYVWCDHCNKYTKAKISFETFKEPITEKPYPLIHAIVCQRCKKLLYWNPNIKT